MEAHQSGGRPKWKHTKPEAAWLPCPGQPCFFPGGGAAVVAAGKVMSRRGLLFKPSRLVYYSPGSHAGRALTFARVDAAVVAPGTVLFR